MRNIKGFALFFLFFSYSSLHSQPGPGLDSTDTFFPNWKEIKNEKIGWYYLTVPEQWDNPDGKKIKLAVAIIKSPSAKPGEPVIFIQGGPGGGAISTLYRWLKHPIRENNDIILLDLRGTGYSQPALCPYLGRAFFRILSRDQSPQNDDKDKIDSAMLCRQDLVNRGVDLSAYNSYSVANDLNALKTLLHLNKWNVYAVSYGTYLAQQYLTIFPGDISKLILDSPIPDISEYYSRNTSNYSHALQSFFDACKKSPQCSKEFPDVENIYYGEIEELDKNPITVAVDKNVNPSGTFTYNAEDFKVVIQQCLYQQKLIEVLPELIYQFHKRNKAVLGALVNAFSGALYLDYGAYYCYTCNEVIPQNSLDTFTIDAQKNKRMRGALDFYKSDFLVCNLWNKKTDSSRIIPAQQHIETPVLILSGEFDPITPTTFAEETKNKFANSVLVYASTYGHEPGFSDTGSLIINDFIKGNNKPDYQSHFQNKNILFRTGISLNKGVINLGKSLAKRDILLFFPLIIATIVLIGNIIYLVRRGRKGQNNRIFDMVSLITSFLGVTGVLVISYAVYTVLQDNFYVLAFGLPGSYSFLFLLQKLFLAASLALILLGIINRKRLIGMNYTTLSLFSIVVINAYYLYWEFYF